MTEFDAVTARVDALTTAVTGMGAPAPDLTETVSALSSAVTGLTEVVDGHGVLLGTAVDEINDLDDRVTVLEGAASPAPTGVAPKTWEVVVNGYTDAAVQAAITTALSGRIGNVVQRKVIFPPGVYNLTQPIIDSDTANHTMIEGLTLEGMGFRSTRINWNPATPGPVIRAIRRLRFFRMEGFTVSSSNAANEFVYAVSDTSGGYNQAWTFRHMEWQGSWLRVVGLDGDATANLNSEMLFDRCSTASDSVFADAFFRSGGISGTFNQQNQFLNYTVRDCFFTVKSGTMFRFDKGGSITVQGGSWSAASSASGPITWFLMPNDGANNRSACQLHVDRVRFEPKASNHLIIDCGWGTGSVEFSNCCDLSSLQQPDPTTVNTYSLHRYTARIPWGSGVGGTLPSVRYVNHQGVGHHAVVGVTSPVGRGGIVYEGCYFWRGTGGQKAPAADGTAGAALTWTGTQPRYEFIHCDNVDAAKSWV
jgi:hypothetical protein